MQRYKITEALDEGATPEVTMCKRCGQWLARTFGKSSTERWAHCEPESRELLGLCLKNVEHRLVKAKLKLLNAEWIWTEPHARRLRVRVTVQKHIDELPNGGVTLQSSKQVEFKVVTRQCTDCAAENSRGGGEPWRAVVQVGRSQNLSLPLPASPCPCLCPHPPLCCPDFFSNTRSGCASPAVPASAHTSPQRF